MSPAAGIDELALSYVARFGEEGFRELLQAGISPDHFDTDFRTSWGYILRMSREHGSVPSSEALLTRYPTLHLVRVKRKDLEPIIRDMKLRYKYIEFLTAANDAAGELGDGWDNVDKVIEATVARYNKLLNDDGRSERLIDLFSEKAQKEILAEISARHDRPGIPTGIPTLDRITGGLYPQRMVVSIGRTGSGKSWLCLLHVAHAVMAGYKVALFSLEMTRFEVAIRLYSIFSFVMNPTKPLSSYELERGLITERKLQKFMDQLKERYEGLLYIGDSSNDAYTLERVRAEVQAVRPAMYWVDYISLMRNPGASGDSWERVAELSKGIKHIATEEKCVGGCSAQVNRQSVREGAPLIPRLEHISFSDSISQDANLVIGMARRKTNLYWAIIKNRHGPETGRKKLEFRPDIGSFEEKEDKKGD